MKTLDRETVAEAARRGLNSLFIGEKWGDKTIAGFEVEILEGEERDSYGGGWHEEIKINIILRGRGQKSKQRLYL